MNLAAQILLQMLVPGVLVPGFASETGPPIADRDERASPPVTRVAQRGVWPLAPPAVERDFAPPATRYGAGHRGVDLAGEPGQRVRAARGGRVTYAGMLAGRGVVVVDHGGQRTTYEPVEATVGRGTVVEAGHPIGTLQRAGSHCFPSVCLHWGLLEAATYLDPLSLVGAGSPRLLPWPDPMSP